MLFRMGVLLRMKEGFTFGMPKVLFGVTMEDGALTEDICRMC